MEGDPMANGSTLEYGSELLASGWTAAHLPTAAGENSAGGGLYKQGLVATGAAAEFAKVPKTLFLNKFRLPDMVR